MSVGSYVMIGLMAFVLLAPTLMVAVLASGLARRGDPAVTPGAHLPRLAGPDRVPMPVEHDQP